MIRELFNWNLVFISLNWEFETKYRHKRLIAGFGDSSRLEDKDWVAKLGQVEESEHVEIVVEGSGKVFSDDALPFAFTTSKLCFVGSEVFDDFEADIFFEHDIGFFLFLSDKFGGFWSKERITSDDFFGEFESHVVVSDFEWREIGVWVLDLLLFFFVLHLLVIFFI